MTEIMLALYIDKKKKTKGRGMNNGESIEYVSMWIEGERRECVKEMGDMGKMMGRRYGMSVGGSIG